MAARTRTAKDTMNTVGVGRPRNVARSRNRVCSVMRRTAMTEKMLSTLSASIKKEEAQERPYWFVLFCYGDLRTTCYGWLAIDKEEQSKAQAASSGKRAAKRRGEREFNEFCVDKSYVTDSPEAFVKKCKSVGLNPDMSDYIQ